jgi:RND family efflux transporter MFP subunit
METSSDTQKSLPVILRILRFLVVILIGVGVAAGLILSKKKPEQQNVIKTPPSVRAIVVSPESKVMEVEAFGTVKPRTLVKIAAEVPGKIEYIHPSFIEGGRINKDDLLIRIDQRSYKLDRQSAEVKVRQARTDIESLTQDIENLKNDIKLSESNASLAQKEFKRISALSENQFASKTMLDRAEQQYLQAKIALQNISNRLVMTRPMMEQKEASLSMAKLNFQKADLAYNKTRIVSPFDGWVLKKMLEAGEYVNPGQIIGSIYEKDSLDVDISIPLEMMKWVNPVMENGQTPEAQISIASSEGIITHTWQAKVARFKANIDEKTRTLPMTLEINLAGKKQNGVFDLRPGAFVKCSIQGVIHDNIFVVPRHLLKTGDILFTINDSHLKMKKVSVLRKFEEEVFINDGLNPGDKIISSPLPGALEGMMLTIKTNGE